MISVVTDDAAFAALRPAWQALHDGVPDASPFQHPDWAFAWWRRFGNGRPVVATLQRDGALAGLLPCYRFAEGAGAKLLPIGISLSDHHDALLAPGLPAEDASRLLAGVLAAGDADACDLVDLPPGALLRSAEAPPGWRVVESAGEPCPVLALPVGGSPDAVVPGAQRRKLRMNRHRAERIGGSTLAFAVDLTAPLDRLIGWQRERREALGDAGMSPAAAAFLHEAAPALHRAGRARLAMLHVGGAAAAACLVLAAGARWMLYMSGFDPAFAACSPGTLLLGALVERALEEGVDELHFLRGGEAYKYAWGGVARCNVVRRFARKT